MMRTNRTCGLLLLAALAGGTARADLLTTATRTGALRDQLAQRRQALLSEPSRGRSIEVGTHGQLGLGYGLSVGLAKEHARGRQKMSLLIAPKLKVGLAASHGYSAELNAWHRQTIPLSEVRAEVGAAYGIGLAANTSVPETIAEERTGAQAKGVSVHLGTGLTIASAEVRMNLKLPLFHRAEPRLRALDKAARFLDEADHAALKGDEARADALIAKARRLHESTIPLAD